MSEWCVNSYFVEKEEIEKSFGSKNQRLIEQVLEDRDEIISDFNENGFADEDFEKGISIEVAIEDLINGNIKNVFPFKNSIATWAIVATISKSRPINSTIGYPFLRLSDFTEIIKEGGKFPNLLDVLESLDGQNSKYDLPINMKEWGDMPRISYIESVSDDLVLEINEMKKDFEDEADWLFDFDEDPEDIEQILDWLLEAKNKSKSICLIMDGDL